MKEEIEQTWYAVKVFLINNPNFLKLSITEYELENLKALFISRDEFENITFESTHEFSTRILLDVNEIVAICETKEYGD